MSVHVPVHMNAIGSGSYARNFHIELDPDHELIKNTRPVSNKTHDDRIVYLVIAIDLEVKNEQFRLCFMS